MEVVFRRSLFSFSDLLIMVTKIISPIKKIRIKTAVYDEDLCNFILLANLSDELIANVKIKLRKN